MQLVGRAPVTHMAGQVKQRRMISDRLLVRRAPRDGKAQRARKRKRKYLVGGGLGGDHLAGRIRHLCLELLNRTWHRRGAPALAIAPRKHHQLPKRPRGARPLPGRADAW